MFDLIAFLFFFLLVAMDCSRVGTLSEKDIAEIKNACYIPGSPHIIHICTTSYNYCSYYEQHSHPTGERCVGERQGRERGGGPNLRE